MTRSRLKVVIGFGLIMSFLCAYSIYKGMDAVAVILSGGIAGIVAKYCNDESNNPSIKRD